MPIQPVRGPDAGSRAWAWRAGIAALVVVIGVAVLQRWPEAPPAAPPPGSPAFVAAEPQADLTGRFVLKMARSLRSLSPGQPAGDLTANMDILARASKAPADWVRSGIVAAELWRVEGDAAIGRGAAEPRLADAEKLLPRVKEDADREALERDIATLRAIYGADDAGSADPVSMDAAVSPEARRELLERYGYYGRVALAYHLPDHASERAMLFEGGGLLLLLTVGFICAAGVAGLTGLVLLILGVVRIVGGGLRPRFAPPAPGGSVYVEAFVIFLVGFVGLSFVGGAVASAFKGAEWVSPLLLLSNWLLVLVPLWVVARGTPLADATRQLGLHRGRGVLREVGAGIAGYLAGLPLVFLSVIVALGLVMVQNAIVGTPDATPRNPLFDRLATGDAAFLAALFFMATVWAPLVEETVFRGCLYRHLSARLAFPLAGGLTAVTFGLVHGVPLPLTLPLMTLGFVFAFMRHWRGSLIASITAHALHNATVLTFAVSMLVLLRE